MKSITLAATSVGPCHHIAWHLALDEKHQAAEQRGAQFAVLAQHRVAPRPFAPRDSLAYL